MPGTEVKSGEILIAGCPATKSQIVLEHLTEDEWNWLKEVEKPKAVGIFYELRYNKATGIVALTGVTTTPITDYQQFVSLNQYARHVAEVARLRNALENHRKGWSD